MNTHRNEVVPVARSVPAVSDSGEMREWAEQVVARARSEGVELTGDNGLLTAMVRQVLKTGLNVEFTEHLGYERGLSSNAAGSCVKKSRGDSSSTGTVARHPPTNAVRFTRLLLRRSGVPVRNRHPEPYLGAGAYPTRQRDQPGRARPDSYARTTSCALSRAPVLVIALLTWVGAVAVLMIGRSRSRRWRGPRRRGRRLRARGR